MRVRRLTASFVVVLLIASGGCQPTAEEPGEESAAVGTEPIVEPPLPFEDRFRLRAAQRHEPPLPPS